MTVHGGVREGAGRRAADVSEPIVKAKVGLTQTQWDYIETQGDNYSAGLRKIINDHMSPQKVKVVEVVKTHRVKRERKPEVKARIEEKERKKKVPMTEDEFTLMRKKELNYGADFKGGLPFAKQMSAEYAAYLEAF